MQPRASSCARRYRLDSRTPLAKEVTILELSWNCCANKEANSLIRAPLREFFEQLFASQQDLKHQTTKHHTTKHHTTKHHTAHHRSRRVTDNGKTRRTESQTTPRTALPTTFTGRAV
jgi:ABC-type proline/glycine betaine transport system ATPase subunit